MQNAVNGGVSAMAVHALHQGTSKVISSRHGCINIGVGVMNETDTWRITRMFLLEPYHLHHRGGHCGRKARLMLLGFANGALTKTT